MRIILFVLWGIFVNSSVQAEITDQLVRACDYQKIKEINVSSEFVITDVADSFDLAVAAKEKGDALMFANCFNVSQHIKEIFERDFPNQPLFVTAISQIPSEKDQKNATTELIEKYDENGYFSGIDIKGDVLLSLFYSKNSDNSDMIGTAGADFTIDWKEITWTNKGNWTYSNSEDGANSSYVVDSEVQYPISNLAGDGAHPVLKGFDIFVNGRIAKDANDTFSQRAVLGVGKSYVYQCLKIRGSVGPGASRVQADLGSAQTSTFINIGVREECAITDNHKVYAEQSFDVGDSGQTNKFMLGADMRFFDAFRVGPEVTHTRYRGFKNNPPNDTTGKITARVSFEDIGRFVIKASK